ncbi:3958_t:CDS:2, partial [Dentiscutata heterogama]
LSNEVTSPETKYYKAVAIPKLELALKKFILIYQNHTSLSDAMIVEKAKLLAEKLGVSKGKLYFSARWILEQGWEEVLADTISNCWNHTQILPPSASYLDNLHETNDLELRDLISLLDMLCLPNAMEVNEFLNINGKEV